MESRPYIRLDRLADEIASFAATEPLSPPQIINGHIIGCTLYRPPGPLPSHSSDEGRAARVATGSVEAGDVE